MPMKRGSARQLTDWNDDIHDVDWTADGQKLIYSVAGRLWRIPTFGSRIKRDTPIAEIPAPVGRFSIARPARDGTTQIAFLTRRREVVMRLIDLEASMVDGKLQSGKPIAAS